MSKEIITIAKFLNQLSDKSPLWNDDIGYTKQWVFKDYKLQEILEDSSCAEKWFNLQEEYWGKGCKPLLRTDIYKRWIKTK